MTANASYIIPYVIEKTGRGERTYDIYSRLLEDRIIFIGTAIDDMVGQLGDGAAALPRQVQQVAGHQHLHQLAGRLGDGGPGHLRHDAVRAAARRDVLPRARRRRWARLVVRRDQGQAFRAARTRA
jgi:hypothetical protein